MLHGTMEATRPKTTPISCGRPLSISCGMNSFTVQVRKKRLTQLASGLPSGTVPRKSKHSWLLSPRQKGSCDKYIYLFPQSPPAHLVPHPAGEDVRGSAREQMRFSAQSRTGEGVLVAPPSGVGPRVQEEWCLSRPPRTRWPSCPQSLSRCICYSQRCHSSARRMTPWTVDREGKGEREGRVRHGQGQHGLVRAPDHLQVQSKEARRLPARVSLWSRLGPRQDSGEPSVGSLAGGREGG